MRFCSVLKLPPKVANKATALSKEAENHSFASGKAPASIAAASILAAADMEHDSNLHKSVEEVAEATHISASTLKQMYKAMQSNANVLLAALEKTKI
ncbi:hypothetical protein MHBO_001119 [Bonamia ostreae]|uniref:Transcription factor TFIIB cyclin-like domain-containing protein n=1 Tax=Bonamia ostreae TaxID=126728 RepID=A0ABV2AHX1_9EUKA